MTTQTTKCPICAAKSGDVISCPHGDAEIVHFRKKSGWSVFERVAAVVPNYDQIKHDTFSEDCECQPRWEGHILIHEAMDGRKAYEG